MVFFQYWVTFFSTIYIIYFYINVFFFYGSSDWFLIQFFKKIEYLNNVEVFCNLITVFIFIVGIVLKLGITPFHLYKVEVYKGIPFISIFFYTTFYFVVFFLFFLFFLSDFFLIFSINFFTFFTVLIFFGSFYIMSLLFDIGFTKVFFTYSTVINTVGFLIAFLSNM